MIRSLYQILFGILSLPSLVVAQDCLLQVPNDPLKAGLFMPWYVSTAPGSTLPCSQLIQGSEVFVEATITDLVTCELFVYSPLVIDAGTTPAYPILPGILPASNQVVIHIGANGNSVTLIPSYDSNTYYKSSKYKDSMDHGQCVNGLKSYSTKSIFGQFAYCNAPNFFNAINTMIVANSITIPPLGKSNLGDECPSTRHYGVVDQDPSDNVITQYIVTNNNKIAQDYTANRNNLLRIIKNGSDNRLLPNAIDNAVGCLPFEAPDLYDRLVKKPSAALNAIHSALTTQPQALTPSADPMCLVNGQLNLQKTNLFRAGVNQPQLTQLSTQDNINYCNNLINIGIPYFILHQNEFANAQSPDNTANNLLNFLCNRFANTWAQIGCPVLIGKQCPIGITKDANGVAIGNTLTTISSTVPTSSATTVSSSSTSSSTVPTSVTTTSSVAMTTMTVNPLFNFCGTSFNNINCQLPCFMGLNSECPTGNSCFNAPGICAAQTSPTSQPPTYYPPLLSANNFCGISFTEVNCSQPCPNGLQSECTTANYTCFNNPALCPNNKVCAPNNLSLYCGQLCPNGTDGECSPGNMCFSTNQTCDSSTPSSSSGFAGLTFSSPTSNSASYNTNLILCVLSIIFALLNTIN
jgi:hypothetical protein